MKYLRSLSIVGTVMAAVFVLGLGIANANIIPTNTGITGTGPYVWTYQAQLSADQNAFDGSAPAGNPVSNLEFATGSFFTIYDFLGYVDGSATVPLLSGWSYSVQNVGFTPIDVFPIDNASISNITWILTSGPDLLGQPSGKDLGNFTAQSIYDTPTQVSYASRGLANAVSQEKPSIADNVGKTQGPTSAVPEPATMLLLGFGLVGLAGAGRKLKR